MQDENATYTTSDFYIAAYLRASEILPFIGINKTDPRRFRFTFSDSNARKQLVDDFFAGRAMVDARQFIAAIKELKSLMYSDAKHP